MILTVYTPNQQVFETYWYGYGTVVSQGPVNEGRGWRTVVNYGDDSYHAKYQQGRFQSGLYYADLQER